MSRYPLPLPFGWYQIAWPDEVAVDAPVRRECFATEVELSVDEAGTYTVRDLATDAEWPVVCRNGLVVTWFHPKGAAPSFDVPALPEVDGHPDFSEPIRRIHRINANWQEMAETAADVAHIQQHLVRYGDQLGADAGKGQPPTVGSTNWTGPHAWMRLTQQFPTPHGVLDGSIDTDQWGPGFAVTWFRGLVDTCLLGCTLPLDVDRTEIRFTFVVKKVGEGTNGLAEAFVNEIEHLAVEDVEIWEHKAYLARPALADTDGPIMKFRHWAEQFYDDRTPISA